MGGRFEHTALGPRRRSILFSASGSGLPQSRRKRLATPNQTSVPQFPKSEERRRSPGGPVIYVESGVEHWLQKAATTRIAMLKREPARDDPRFCLPTTELLASSAGASHKTCLHGRRIPYSWNLYVCKVPAPYQPELDDGHRRKRAPGVTSLYSISSSLENRSLVRQKPPEDHVRARSMLSFPLSLPGPFCEFGRAHHWG